MSATRPVSLTRRRGAKYRWLIERKNESIRLTDAEFDAIIAMHESMKAGTNKKRATFHGWEA